MLWSGSSNFWKMWRKSLSSHWFIAVANDPDSARQGWLVERIKFGRSSTITCSFEWFRLLILTGVAYKNG